MAMKNTAGTSGPGGQRSLWNRLRTVSRRSILAAGGFLLLTGSRPRTWTNPDAGTHVPRSEWGANPLKDNHEPMSAITRITLHHTADVPGMGVQSDAELMRVIQGFHEGRGWADIGYHYVVGGDCRIYEGRALNVTGAHAGAGSNAENLGICVMGNFSDALPPAQQLLTLETFLREQQERYAVPASRIYGHCDLKETTVCPGAPLYEWLGRYKAG